MTGPAIAATDLGPIGALLVGHDHYGDNLGSAGRILLQAAGAVLTTTTTTGAGRLGGNARVRFPITGPVRYSMTAREAIELCQLVRPRAAIPVHYEGWTHFHQDRPAIEREFARAPADRALPAWRGGPGP